MKNSLLSFLTFLLCLCASQSGFSQTKNDNPLYNNIAGEFCTCLNEHFNKFPAKLKEILSKESVTKASFQADITAAIQENPSLMNEMNEAFGSINMEVIMEGCKNTIVTKFKEVEGIGNASEDEIIKNLMSSMKARTDCRIIYNLMMMGLSEEE
jgi:hypothetical protein